MTMGTIAEGERSNPAAMVIIPIGGRGVKKPRPETGGTAQRRRGAVIKAYTRARLFGQGRNARLTGFDCKNYLLSKIVAKRLTTTRI